METPRNSNAEIWGALLIAVLGRTGNATPCEGTSEDDAQREQKRRRLMLMHPVQRNAESASSAAPTRVANKVSSISSDILT